MSACSWCGLLHCQQKQQKSTLYSLKTASPFPGKEAACTRVSCAERAWTAPDSRPPAEPLRGNTAATEVTCSKTCNGLETVTHHRSGKRRFEGVCAQTHTGTRPQER